MPRIPCCLTSAVHKCELILVHGDNLRALLSLLAVDSPIWNHFDGSPESEFSFFCKEDLISNLDGLTNKGHLEDFLTRLVDIENVPVKTWFQTDGKIESACNSPLTIEYGLEGERFLDSSDMESLLPQRTGTDTSSPTVSTDCGSGSDPFRDPSPEPSDCDDDSAPLLTPSNTESTWSKTSSKHGTKWIGSTDYSSDRDDYWSKIGSSSEKKVTAKGRWWLSSLFGSKTMEESRPDHSEYQRIPESPDPNFKYPQTADRLP
jgi:hypothetical protein